MSSTDRLRPPSARRSRNPRRGARRGASLVLGALAGTALAVTLSGLASASTHATLRSATSSDLNEAIVVNAAGRTVYRLRPETTHHLLCASRKCLKVWHPVTASRNARLVEGAGVTGQIKILSRAHGVHQVTLSGEPLYTFAGDSADGQAHGQGIHSFGGTWMVLRAKSNGPAPAPQQNTTTTSSSSSTPTYPTYTGTTTTSTTSTTTTTTSPTTTTTYSYYPYY